METIDNFDFGYRKYTRYPWDKWTDGRIWKLRKGVDFGTVEALRYRAGKIAWEKGLNLNFEAVEWDTVILQFVPPGQDTWHNGQLYRGVLYHHGPDNNQPEGTNDEA